MKFDYISPITIEEWHKIRIKIKNRATKLYERVEKEENKLINTRKKCNLNENNSQLILKYTSQIKALKEQLLSSWLETLGDKQEVQKETPFKH